MEYRRRLRVLLKMRAKGIFYRNFPVCLAVTLITQAISMLGGYAAGLVLPSANDFVYAADPTIFLPQFLQFYGILYGVFLISAPLTMGSYAWFSDLSMQRSPKIREVFNWLGDFHLLLKAFGAMLWLTGLAILWALAYLGIPAATIWFVTAKLSQIPVQAVVFLSGILTMVTIVGTVFTVLRVFAYLPALYLLAAHPAMRIREAFRECSHFMSGRQGEFLELMISFAGWFLLNGFTGGLTSLYVSPYFNLTVLSFTQQARGIWLAEQGKQPDAVWTPEEQEPREDDSDV